MTMEQYLKQALRGFLADPPDSQFQRGYLAGLCAVAEELETDDVELASLVIQCKVQL